MGADAGALGDVAVHGIPDQMDSMEGTWQYQNESGLSLKHIHTHITMVAIYKH